MKRFISKTIFLILPLILIALAIEFMLRAIPNDYQLKRNYLDANAEDIEVLILGNSHSLYSLDPIYFDKKTFNAAHVSQSLDYDYAILNKYEASLNHLNTIILPISYFSLFETLDSSYETWRTKNYHLYYDIHLNKNWRNYTEVFSMRLHTNLFRLLDYYILRNNSISCSGLGWGTIHLSKDAKNLKETGIETADYHSVDDVFNPEIQKIYEENISSLRNILLWSQEKHINVILITFPADKNYIEHLNELQLNMTIASAEKLANEFDNCIYLNLLNDSMFTSGDYYDADHLSEIGAEKLSKRINTKIYNLR